MLIWCYDGVQRDGTIEVSLERATTDIGKPYRTIKEWWRQLREGPFFTEIKDRGHKGWLVRMADEWLDWHVMANNYPNRQGQDIAPKQETPRPTQGQSAALEVPQGPPKDASRTRQGQNTALEHSRNKVLHDDQNPESVNEFADSPARTPAVSLYFEFYPNEMLDPNNVADINRTVTDLKRWREVLKYWRGNGYRAKSVPKMLDRYSSGITIADERPAQSNGHKRPPADLPLSVADPNKKRLSLAERQRILSEIRTNDTS